MHNSAEMGEAEIEGVKRLAALKHVDDLLQGTAHMKIQQPLISSGSVFVLVISSRASLLPQHVNSHCNTS